MTRPTAVVSDIHGNRWAFETVLRDIEDRGIDSIVNLGDCAYGPLDPAGTTQLLMDREIPTVRGNEDRILADDATSGPTLDYVTRQLSDVQRDWLVSLPFTLTIDPGIFLCHASPTADTDYFAREVRDGKVVEREATDLLALWPTSDVAVLLCGHDHLPCTIHLPGDRLLVNPGSVGLQAYTDDQPPPHVVEAGSPHARYCILRRGEEGWDVEHRVLEYDWAVAARCALDNGRPDWALWLRSGRTT